MSSFIAKFKPKNFILDIDGVFTDGKFYYTRRGKIMKKFGPEDNDGLDLIKDKLHIHTVTGDKRGFEISKLRMDDMKLPCDLISTFERVGWIKKNFNPDETIYMGDGIFDPLVFTEVAYSIAPANAFYLTKEKADFVTRSRGSEGAVAEASIHILEKFFSEKFDLEKIDLTKKSSGVWRKETK